MVYTSDNLITEHAREGDRSNILLSRRNRYYYYFCRSVAGGANFWL